MARACRENPLNLIWIIPAQGETEYIITGPRMLILNISRVRLFFIFRRFYSMEQFKPSSAMHKKTAVLLECAVMVALSVALSFVKILQMPFGGSVTLLSMLPVCLVSIRHGLKWGFGASFVFSVLSLLFDLSILGWGLTPVILVGCFFLDYLIAYTVLGIAGIWRSRGFGGIMAGTALAVFLRFLSHFISGIVLWTNLEQFELFGRSWVNRPVLYSLIYNGMYMLPELVFTMIAAPFIYQRVEKYLRSRNVSAGSINI